MMKQAMGLTVLLLGVAAFYVLAFYPGYMSWDSSYHYRQLLSGEWTTFQPTIILLFWKLTDAVIAGPGGLFLLFLAMYLLGLGLLSYALRGGWLSKVCLVFTALLPVNIMLFPHIWKDIGLLVFVLLSVACLLFALYRPCRWLLWLSVLFLMVGVLFRFESILYLWPLVGLQAQCLFDVKSPERQTPWYSWRVIGFVLAVAVMSVGANSALAKLSHSQKMILWPTIALWDIARVSVGEDNMLMPSYTVGPNMDVADLAQATHVWTNTSLFSGTKAGVNNALAVPYTAAQYRHLLGVWVGLPMRYPISYFSHRYALFKELLRFGESPDKPQSLFWINQMVAYGEQFPINSSRLNQVVNQALVAYKNHIYFKPWFFVVLAVLLLAFLQVKTALNPQQRLARRLLLSSLVSLGVLFFLAPAAEQRYVIMLFNFVPIAACFVLAKVPQGRSLYRRLSPEFAS